MAGKVTVTVNSLPGGAVSSGETAELTGMVYDDSNPPAALPAAALTTLTLTIVDRNHGIVNGVNNQSILNEDRGIVDGNGKLTVLLHPEDTLLPAGVPTATRSLVFRFSWNGGAKIAFTQVDFPISVLAA